MNPPPLPSFINGDQVEVTSQEPGFIDSWYTAKIIKKVAKKPNLARKSNKFLVEYQTLIDDQTLNPLKEEVHLKNIRPLQPQQQQPLTLFQMKEEVDAFHSDGWWKGIVSKVLDDSQYLVEFQNFDENEMVFKQSDLRPHLEWIDGKWVNLAHQDQEVTAVELDEGNGNFPNPIASSSCSSGMDTQLTPSVVIDKPLGKVTSSSGNHAEQVGNDKTMSEADPPCDPLFSSQKDKEQSTLEGNNDFLGSHKKVGRQKMTDVSMSIRACSERGTSTRRSENEIRRTRNSSSSELFFNSSESPTRGNPVSLGIGEEKSKDDLESKCSEMNVSTECSHLYSDLMEVERSVVLSSPRSNTQCQEEQKVVLSTEQIKETSTPLQEDDRVNTQSGVTVKRKSSRQKGSGKKKKANTSGSQNRIISPLKGPEKESSRTKNTDAQMQCSELPTSSTAENAKTQCSELPSSTVDKTQCSELPSLAVTNHQIPSVHLEKSGAYAVGNTGTETEAANRNPVNDFDSMQMEKTKVDTDQTPNLVPEMSNNPTTEIGLESGSTCTENIAVGTVLDFVCPLNLSSTIEEHQALSPTPDHGNQASESKAGMDMTNGEINQAQMPCPSILDKPLIVENNEDIQVALDEAMDEPPLDSVMDLQQLSIAPPDSPPPVVHEEQQIQLFEKKSPMWKLLDELEVFKSYPQNPHFSPLENEPEELREGKAFGHMCVFESLVNKTNKASIEEERHVFVTRLEALNELEAHGFKVRKMRWKLEKMIEIKDKLDEAGHSPDSSELEIEEAENELEDLKRQLETLFAREEKITRNLARLRKLREEANKRARLLRLEFNRVASAI